MEPKYTLYWNLYFSDTCPLGLGLSAGYGWWYGYHVPTVRQRDAFYQKIEEERAQAIRDLQNS
ncbi:hypothetical protein M501DRAFT_1002562 [Patellaria atrata CBS 101060]|uniref:Uncharacterized protein n=1 Tax=Patellaria atrata CBS 101060 TaxID=1346257 RepID=A0A9P4SEA3_9PEZI|nr:hypothetical protein M501DRAFT_1002562 [Patellaria atrata CBS 101060]